MTREGLEKKWGERTEGGLGMSRVEADRLNNACPLAGVSGYRLN